MCFFVACKKDVGDANFGNYPHDVGKIIITKCAVSGCHNSLSFKSAAGLNLESWNTLFAGANSGSPVIPFNSSFSSLCYYINTFSELGLQNKPTMPFNGEPLSKEEVMLIKNWIDDGAKDLNNNVKWGDNPGRKKLYAVNQGCDVVTVFDSETRLPMRYITVGDRPSSTPHHVRVSPDGKFWYVIFINSNIMQKFRCSDDSYVGNIPLTPLAAGTGADDALNWNTFIITKNSKLAYCVSWPDGKVSCVDLENGKHLKFLGGQHYSHGIGLNAAEDKIYITAQTGNFITEIDTGFTTSTRYPLDNGVVNLQSSLDPHDIILSPDGEDFLITCQASNDVRVFNIATHNVTSTISTGAYPQEIVYSKRYHQYFVSCTNDSTSGSLGAITRIDGNTYSTTKVKCGYQPHGIAVDEGKNLLYVLSRNISSKGPLPHHTSQCLGKNGFVNFIELGTFTVTDKKYELSVDPYFIFARP
jgi:YVTN family beta-propeller protein